ncbi:MAG TPA: PLP-dependent transferase [Kiritimatiellia bacterium]|nr:PLP-dependent transferase [Kiritimatiellia bacterium]
MTGNGEESLLVHPRWRPGELGEPLPESPHANSVCLPTWQDVVDYEEKNPRVIERLRAGYPRFVVPPQCAAWFELCLKRLGREGEGCHAYPSEGSARRCARLIEQWSGAEARVVAWEGGPVHLVFFPQEAREFALKYWRHTGDGISSRRAEALLAGRAERRDEKAYEETRRRLAEHAGVPESNVFLFKSGMAGIYTLFRALHRRRPGAAAVQFGFPYVDTLKILQDFGHEHVFYPRGDEAELEALAKRASSDMLAGIFCEFPSNPLLFSPDVGRLGEIARLHRIPLVVDDTIATSVNVDLMGAADAVVTSLTKYFTGRGDLMAGAVILNPASPRYDELYDGLAAEFEDCLWGDTLSLVAEASRDYSQRVDRINETTLHVVNWLREHPGVDAICHPSVTRRMVYDGFRKPGGGYGGLFSVILKDAAVKAPRFYDGLEISKGPNLGTVFSLCCPFTLLAHYHELEWAESCGVSRNLLRFSIGLEPAEELILRLDRALSATSG